MNGSSLEGMRERQRTSLQEQLVPLRHPGVFQHEDRHPAMLERFRRPGLGTAGFSVRGDHDGVIGQAVDQPVAAHLPLDGMTGISGRFHRNTQP